MSEFVVSQLDGRLVIVTLAGVLVAAGDTPIAPTTLVHAVPVEDREYQVTSSRPSAFATRSAGRNVTPPPCGASSVVGNRCTRLSEPTLKLCIKMSPFRWCLTSFQTMLTSPNRLLTAILGKSWSGK